MPSDALVVMHNVLIEVYGPDGALKDSREIHNLVTTAGKEAVAKLLKEGTVRPEYIAVGTGTEEAKAADTKLKTEKVRKAGTVKVVAAVLTVEREFAAGEAEGAITEEGVLSAAAEGTLFARSVFAAVTIGAKDTCSVIHEITVG